MKKSGIVLLLGRPNVGKSTLLNTLIGQKVSITSPKSQTTRAPLKALFEDERGQLLFVDTPGVFLKAQDKLSKTINRRTLSAVEEDFDVAVYMVDQTRARNFEEGRVAGIVRGISKPKILVINKIDAEGPNHYAEYRYLEDEIPEVYKISALKQKHLKPLLDGIFEKVNRPYPIVPPEDVGHPGLTLHSTQFVEEIIREKIYLFTREEVPYKTGVHVEEITERKSGLLYIKAQILVTDKRYRKMLIGREGRMVTEIGRAARKELELARGKKVFLDLRIETDYHLLDNV
ncbi:MAG: GTPase Era [Patescibacteria group bacterium]|jgi:GTP-binding protein Era